MTLPDFAGCPWPVNAGCCDNWDNYEEDVAERSIAMASATLERLTAYRVTNWAVTVRPCKKSWASRWPWYSYYSGGYGFYPYMNESGNWVNSCGCQTDCSCTTLCQVHLPGPVGRLDAVKLDGATVNPTNYRLSGENLIWAGSGACPWPTCQDLSKPDTQVGTFSVTYVNGYPPDGYAAYAAGILACEFAKACSGGNCRLPAGVTAVVRQGVTMTLMTGAFPDGLTGIREVDAFIALWNPKGRQQESAVWSPDMAPVVIQ